VVVITEANNLEETIRKLAALRDFVLAHYADENQDHFRTEAYLLALQAQVSPDTASPYGNSPKEIFKRRHEAVMAARQEPEL
jgi:hypothetical protein